jgi:hypothetical protein
MSRFRLRPTSAQERALLEHCAHAPFVWNLACDQHAFAQAMANYFGHTHGRPTWRRARHEGFRVAGRRGRRWDVRRLSREWGEAEVPKIGWVRFQPIHGPGTGQVVGIDRGIAEAPGRVEEINPAYTSRCCSVCVARNIAAGPAVTAWGGSPSCEPVNREPQLLTSVQVEG